MKKTLNKVIFILISVLILLILQKNTAQAALALVGKEASLGERVYVNFGENMAGMGSNVYCTQPGQHFSGGAYFTVGVYVHIENGIATVSGIGGESGEYGPSDSNKIMAQIVSGEYGSGYGYFNSEHTGNTGAQYGVWAYFPDWAASVGINSTWYSAPVIYGNDEVDGSSIVQKATAAVASGTEPKPVDIYLLAPDSSSEGAKQKIIYVENSESPDVETKGEGVVKINGYVTIAGGTGKDSQSAKTIPGDGDTVEIWWKTEDGKVLGHIDSYEINSSKPYEMEAKISIRDHFYKVPDSERTKFNNSYVEFEYNGLKYTTEMTTNDIQLDNKNYNTAIENSGLRGMVDGNYNVVSSNQSQLAVKENNLVRASTQNVLSVLLDTVEKKAKAAGANAGKWLESNKQWCTNGKGNPDGQGDFSVCDNNYPGKTKFEGDCTNKSYGPGKPRHGSHSFSWEETHTWFDDQGNMGTSTITKNGTHDPCSDYYKQKIIEDGEICVPDVWIINGVNLQLIPREMADAALESDISNVKVIMNEQEYTYEYGNRGIKQFAATPTAEFSDDNKTYSRPINPASVRQVVREKDENSLQLYVTYNINAYNQANTLYTQILNVINYYDSDKYVLATEEECNKYNLPSNVGWYENTDVSTGGTYKAYSHSTTQETDGSGNKLYPILTDTGRSWTDAGGKELQITYKVKYNVISDFCHRGEELLYNVSEIGAFKPMYGQHTVYAEHTQDGARKYNTYAAVDYDSTPSNANPQSETNTCANPEDDSDIAPIFRIIFDDNKIVTGTVWEDNSEVDTSNGTRNGNGKNENEKTVSNVRVELIDATTGDIAKLYPLEVRNSEDTNSPKRDEDLIKEGNTNAKKVTDYLARYPVGDTKEGIRSYDAITYTDKDGNYSFEGVPEKEYIIKYTYGDNEETITSGFSNEQKNNITQKANGKIVTTVDGATAINARNYKSTIITNDTIKALMKKSRNNYTDTDYKWHLRNDIDNSSIAVDDLNERLKISDLENSNFETPQTITAYSIPFKIQVEYDYNGDYTNQNYKVKDNGTKQDNGGNFTYTWSTFDFGIVERARESLIVDKTINNLKVTLANGQILTEGNPYGKDNLSYVKAIGEKGIITKRNEVANNTAKDRNLYIEIDSELIQGATIDITYAITVTDNNETDYEYSNSGTNGEYNDITGVNHITTGTNASYYYYGEAGNLQTIRPSVKLIADYMDQELTCDVNDSQNKDYGWKQALAKQENGSYYLDYSDNKDGSERISISKETYDVMQDTTNGNYLIFVTDYFKDIHSLAEKRTQNKSVYEPNEYKTNENQKTAYLHASKLLANQTNYVYENHAEILKIDGKVARNIDSTDGGKQIEKTYKPGNYVPSLKQRSMDKAADVEIAKVHEQDDDMITVRITPPTGLTNYTTLYIIVGGITLTVLAVGVIIIKRKVLA